MKICNIHEETKFSYKIKLFQFLEIYEYFGAHLCSLKVKTSYFKEKIWYVSGLVVFKSCMLCVC